LTVFCNTAHMRLILPWWWAVRSEWPCLVAMTTWPWRPQRRLRKVKKVKWIWTNCFHSLPLIRLRKKTLKFRERVSDMDVTSEVSLEVMSPGDILKRQFYHYSVKKHSKSPVLVVSKKPISWRIIAENKRFRILILRRTIATLKKPPRRPAQIELIEITEKLVIQTIHKGRGPYLAIDSKAMNTIAWVNFDFDFSMAIPWITWPVNHGVNISAEGKGRCRAKKLDLQTYQRRRQSWRWKQWGEGEYQESRISPDAR
jgi:hypothetical protein